MVVSQSTTEPQYLFFETDSLKDVPDRIQVLPVGVFDHPTYGTVDLSLGVLDEIVANFNAQTYGQTLPISIEHDPNSGAAGHITSLIRNDDGSVDATVDWNPHGRQALAEDRFRYISPELRTDWLNPITRAKAGNLLVGAGLTTKPYFKSETLRPLIVASEPVDGRQKGTVSMADPKEPTPTPTPAPEPAPEPKPDNGNDPVAKRFGEMLADRDSKLVTLSERLTVVETENKALKDAAQERTFREQLAGAPDIDKKIGILKELSEERRADYIAEVQGNVATRKALHGRGEIGSDANGKQTGSTLSDLNAKADELRKTRPELSREQAFTEVAKDNPELSRRAYAEQAQA